MGELADESLVHANVGYMYPQLLNDAAFRAVLMKDDKEFTCV